MVLGKWKKSLSSGGSDPDAKSEEFIEMDVGGGQIAPKGKLGIRIESLADFAETEKVLKYVREGNIVFLKIKTLKEKDLSELKRAVEKLKRTVLAQSGDLVGVEQDWLLVVPEHATVHR